MTWKLRASVLALFVVAACKDLPDVPTDTCGNGVLETGEDCEPVGDAGAGQCGEPGGANACFYECVIGEIDCPDGFGCGVDNRCRQAAGAFESVASLSLAADELATGDVDNDGFDDLVAVSGTSVEVDFGSSTADFSSAVDTLVATPQRGLALGDLDRNGADDLLVGTSIGVQTLLGSSDRALDPFSYPVATIEPDSSIALGVAVDVDGVPATDEVLSVWADQIGFPVISSTARIALPDHPGAQTGTVQNLIAPLPVARLTSNRSNGIADDAEDPDYEVALAYNGTQTIHLYRAAGGPVQVVDLATPIDVGQALNGSSGMFFGYFNGDGCIDLAAHVGLGGQLVVFRNTAGGATGCTGALQAPIDMVNLSAGDRLLAVADFDGDGITDLVTARGVQRITGTGPWTATQVAIAGAPYESALAVDINGDGALDVAAFRESQPDVDVLVNAGSNLFNRFVVATSDPVQRLQAGDFDGDLTDDIAIVELDSSDEEPVFAISVSFGQFHGPPGARVIMDKFDVVSGFLAAGLAGVTGAPDAVDDLAVLENDSAAGALEVSVLFGSGARSMNAPLSLQSSTFEAPEAFILGRFDDQAGLDLFAVGDGNTAFLYSGDGASGELVETGEAPWPSIDVDDLVVGVGDVDGDGETDEIAAAERHGFVGAGDVHVILFAPDPDQLVDDPLIATIEGYAGAHAIRIVDLDGDGDRDVLVGLDPLDSSEGTLRAGWNHGGTIEAVTPIAGADGCIDGVSVQLDGDLQPELIALCKDPDAAPGDRGDFLLRRFDAAEADTLLPQQAALADTSGGRSTRLLAADVNGDGVDDIIVSTRGDQAATVRVFRQIAVNE